jgi:hypothetical protein
MSIRRVHAVRDRMRAFADRVRNSRVAGVTGATALDKVAARYVVRQNAEQLRANLARAQR